MKNPEKFVIKWERVRSKGATFYIAKWGLLYYGLCFFLTWVFLVPFVDSNYTLNFIRKETFSNRLIVFGIVSPIFGILIAYFKWRRCENRYYDYK